MKRALIDKNNSRVVQVVAIGEEFEVHESLYWVDCPDDAETFYLYDPENLTFEDPHAASKDEFGNPVEPFTMQRQRAYPPAGDQMDMLWKELRDTGTISVDGLWFKSILEVKQAIPKPEAYSPDAPVSTVTQWYTADGIFVQLFSDVSGTTSGAGTGAKFKVRKAGDSYQVIATVGGQDYENGDTIELAGDGYSCVVTVTEVSNTGEIIALTV
jgi:hypothetical protein